MKIVGARWTPKVNVYVILCRCGKRFEHRTDRWKVVCPACGARGLVKVLRQRIRRCEMKMWECGVCGKRFGEGTSHVCQGKEVSFADAVKQGNDISSPAGRINAGRVARERRKKVEGDGELENARQVIRELREEKTDREKAWAKETRALEQCEKDRVKADEEIARLDAELEKESRTVKSIARMLGWENVPPQKTIENDLSALKARMERSVQECENTQRLISELRRELESQASRVREAEARGIPDEAGCKAARVEAAKLRADVDGLQLELEAKRVAHEKDNEFLLGERNEAQESLQGAREVWQKFIDECAQMLGLPKMDGCSEYGGGAIRKGINNLVLEAETAEKKLDEAEQMAAGVVEGSADWEDDCKTAQKEVRELRKTLEVSQQSRTGLAETISCYAGALEKINELRNDMIGRQSMGFSRHLYPLVAALNEAGFEGMDYEKAREKVEATIKAAREMAAGAWGQEATRDTVMDVHLAEEFAEILFPFLESLEFYALLGNWQGHKDAARESMCDRDLGGRARAAMGHPDRDVPEIIDDGESPVSRARGAQCCSPKCTKDAEWVIVSGPTVDDCWEACTEHVGELLPDGQEHKVYPVSKDGEADEHSGTGGGPSGDGS